MGPLQQIRINIGTQIVSGLHWVDSNDKWQCD